VFDSSLLLSATKPALHGFAEIDASSHITISGLINQDRPLHMFSTKHILESLHETMLLVEDDTTIAELLVQMISQETHYQFFSVPDGPQALILSKSSNVNSILDIS
jgi:hypothetical protein